MSGADRAYHRYDTDHIQMPDEGFVTGTATMSRTKGYCATLAFELIHWTGSKHRLDRDGVKRFGDHAYAAEELIAKRSIPLRRTGQHARSPRGPCAVFGALADAPQG
jgi:antirestriction protein ArdC